jgi:hypothetical protein
MEEPIEDTKVHGIPVFSPERRQEALELELNFVTG